MQDVGRPLGHSFRNSGMPTRTQVLSITLLCHPYEDLTLNWAARWPSMLYSGFKCGIQTWWGLAIEEILPFPIAFLGAKKYFPERPSKPICFLNILVRIECPFLSQTQAQDRITFGPIRPTLEMGWNQVLLELGRWTPGNIWAPTGQKTREHAGQGIAMSTICISFKNNCQSNQLPHQ